MGHTLVASIPSPVLLPVKVLGSELVPALGFLEKVFVVAPHDLGPLCEALSPFF